MNYALTVGKTASPWSWIPSLYLAEGLPYFAVNTLTVLMYVNMGVSLSDMAFFTGWLYLPWVIKPFWSPFIDLFKTKRWWIVCMEWLIALSMAGVALFLPGNQFFITTLIVFWLMAFFSATHDIAADGFYILALSSHEQAAYVGVRSTFYRVASILGQGGVVMLAGYWEKTFEEVSTAWSYIFYLLSAIFLCISLWHSYRLPFSNNDRPVKGVTFHTVIHDFINAFVTFFKKKNIITALLFMLLYRLPEALCLKLIQPFFMSSHESGGLGLSTSQVGFVNGTVGVIALLSGGIIGGIAISKGGLKKWLWPMALSLTLPCFLYCLLAIFQPDNFILISTAVFIEQFGYGFGFSAYMLYLIYFSKGENSTSHYAFCTAFMAIGMMVPGMFAGLLYDAVSDIKLFSSVNAPGFINFFWIVMTSCLATFLVCFKIKIDHSFGKKNS